MCGGKQNENWSFDEEYVVDNVMEMNDNMYGK